MTVTTSVSEYTVNAVPSDHPEAHRWEITVERRLSGRWIATCLPHILGADGFWVLDSQANRVACEMDEDEALRRACSAAPEVSVNGRTAADVAAEWLAATPVSPQERLDELECYLAAEDDPAGVDEFRDRHPERVAAIDACRAVLAQHAEDEDMGCAYCGDYQPVSWPCPTVRAITNALAKENS